MLASCVTKPLALLSDSFPSSMATDHVASLQHQLLLYGHSMDSTCLATASFVQHDADANLLAGDVCTPANKQGHGGAELSRQA